MTPSKTPSSSHPNSSRALQDSTNARSESTTATKDEIWDEERKRNLNVKEDTETLSMSSKRQIAASSPATSNDVLLVEHSKSAAESEEDSEFSFESTTSSARQDVVNSSPISPAENDTPLSEPSPLELPLSSNLFPNQVSSPKSAVSSTGEDAVESFPFIPTEIDIRFLEHSPFELPLHPKKPCGQRRSSPTANVSAQPPSPCEYSLSSITPFDPIFSVVRDPETSSPPAFRIFQAIFPQTKTLLCPKSDAVCETFRLDITNLVDTRIQDTIQKSSRWPTKRLIDPYDDASSDDEFGNEKHATSKHVLPSSKRASFYTDVAIWGQASNISSPSRASPLGSLPVVRQWISDELEDELQMYYLNPSWMRTCARAAYWDPFPGVNMDCGWQRLYYRAADFYSTYENRIFRELKFKQEEQRVELCESLARFSWKRQSGPRVFNIDCKWWDDSNMYAFFGENYGRSSGWSREPGSWWNAGYRKRLFEMATTLPFLLAVEEETKFIKANVERVVLDWKKPTRDTSPLSRKRQLPEFESEVAETIKLRSFESNTTRLIKVEEDESLLEPELRGVKGKETPSITRFKRDFKNYGQHFLDNRWSQQMRLQQKKAGRWTDATTREEWSKRRRAQEKKAGRWTDGTVRMNRMWEEYHWVCNDEGVMMNIPKVL